MSHKPNAQRAAFKKADHYDDEPKQVDQSFEELERERLEREEKEKQE